MRRTGRPEEIVNAALFRGLFRLGRSTPCRRRRDRVTLCRSLPDLCSAPRRRESPVEEGSIQIVVGLIW
jgi:hypothetical protein